ncbi:hypothetical protein X805_24810 [Sphaerotilus natans subsp. natans DSM 6575]|uniref:Uncharacterized protein n=1 Tax=Sphaerotilus natans subsp. natans DSM 6575 TaxID=1286631 RepID=A0A059KKD0_9BURK|nr:hypothetical protein X805_24810 [Sphaerotilus natans subsp. natans DSM 6575]
MPVAENLQRFAGQLQIDRQATDRQFSRSGLASFGMKIPI